MQVFWIGENMRGEMGCEAEEGGKRNGLGVRAAFTCVGGRNRRPWRGLRTREEVESVSKIHQKNG